MVPEILTYLSEHTRNQFSPKALCRAQARISWKSCIEETLASKAKEVVQDSPELVLGEVEKLDFLRRIIVPSVSNF